MFPRSFFNRFTGDHEAMSESVFLLKDGEILIYRGDGKAGSLGTILPNDEQIVRVIKRAYLLGKKDRSAQINDLLRDGQ